MRISWLTDDPQAALTASMRALAAFESLRASQPSAHARNAVFASWTRDYRWLAGNLLNILGFELMHAAQAVDLRRADDPGLPISDQTKRLHEAYRQVVPFLETDEHVLTVHIGESSTFLAKYNSEN